jgi:hypothetical protein
MYKKVLAGGCLIATILMGSCSKKQVPRGDNGSATTKADSMAIRKAIIKKIPPAKVITVNDKAAKKAVDGRLYYDVDGHRYWRNYNDGKYYLFNKSMYTNDAFKPH